MQPSNANSAIVASKWSHFEPDTTRSYFGFAPLREYLIETAYGPALAAKHKDNRFWAEDVLVSTLLRGRRVKHVLSLCCGFGEVERRVVSRLPSVRDVPGCGPGARGARRSPRSRAPHEGLTGFTYECADLNRYLWPEATYDLIIANGALHHLHRRWSDVLEGIARRAAPGRHALRQRTCRGQSIASLRAATGAHQRRRLPGALPNCAGAVPSRLTIRARFPGWSTGSMCAPPRPLNRHPACEQEPDRVGAGGLQRRCLPFRGAVSIARSQARA